MEKFIFSDAEDFDTFEAYFGDAHIVDTCITIPYINITLMEEHPLNYNKELSFLNFSYLRIIEPKYISIYKKGIIKNELEEYNQKASKWYGGVFIGNDSILDAEIEIQSSSTHLIIPNNYKLSTSMWMPDYKNFKGKGNISEKDILNFFHKIQF